MRSSISLETLLFILLALLLISTLTLYYQNYLVEKISEIKIYENKIKNWDLLQRSIK